MTTGTIKAVPVGDLEEQLAGSPPCQAFVLPYESRCGNPAVVRLEVNCGRCAGKTVAFLCGECLAGARRGWLRCGPVPAYGCGNRDLTWVER